MLLDQRQQRNTFLKERTDDLEAFEGLRTKPVPSRSRVLPHCTSVRQRPVSDDRVGFRSYLTLSSGKKRVVKLTTVYPVILGCFYLQIWVINAVGKQW